MPQNRNELDSEYVDRIVETALANTAEYGKITDARRAAELLEQNARRLAITDQRTPLDIYEDGHKASAARHAKRLELAKAGITL
jgi:hypothetical protein